MGWPMSRVLKYNGFSRAQRVVAFPNNSVPELSLLQTVCSSAGITFGRAYRGGYTFIHELGIDNPLNFGSYVMDSGTNYEAVRNTGKVQGAVDRGEPYLDFRSLHFGRRRPGKRCIFSS